MYSWYVRLWETVSHSSQVENPDEQAASDLALPSGKVKRGLQEQDVEDDAETKHIAKARRLPVDPNFNTPSSSSPEETSLGTHAFASLKCVPTGEHEIRQNVDRDVGTELAVVNHRLPLPNTTADPAGTTGRKTRKKRTGRKVRKTASNSAIAETRKANQIYWRDLMSQDDSCATVHQAKEWSLFVFPPISETKKSGYYQRNLILSQQQRRKLYLADFVFAVQRNDAQISGFRRLDITIHGAGGPKLGLLLRERDGFDVQTLCNYENHPYDPVQKMLPVVFNRGRMVLDTKQALKNLINLHLSEILRLSSRDKDRELCTLNLGITGVQGARWWNFLGVRMPGTMRVGDKLSPELGKAIGEVTIETIDKFREEAFRKKGHTDVQFFPPCPHRELFLRRLSRQLHLPCDLLVPVQGIALILGNATMIHLDTLNDWREGYEWTIVASAILHITSVPQHLRGLVKEAGLSANFFAVMLIFYSRSVVGGKAQFLEHDIGKAKVNPQFKEFIEDMKKEEWRDVELAETCQVQETYAKWLAQSIPDATIKSGCAVSVRPASASQLLFYSSFTDIGTRFLLSLKEIVGRVASIWDLLALLVIFTRDTNGQWLAVKLLIDLLNGNAPVLAGDFKSKFGKDRSIFRLVETHLYYICCNAMPSRTVRYRAEQVRPPNQVNSRFPLCEAILYQSDQDCRNLEEYLDWLMGVLKPLMTQERNTEKCQERAEKALYALMGRRKSGLDHTRAMALIHLASLFGVIRPVYGTIAAVVEDTESGPNRFFKLPVGDEQVKHSFATFCRNIQQGMRKQYSNRLLYNYTCIKGLKHEHRRNDLIFFYGETKMQSLIDLVYRHSTRREKHKVKILLDGEWRLMRDILTPVYEMDKGQELLEFAWEDNNRKKLPKWLASGAAFQLPYGYQSGTVTFRN